MKKKSLRVKNKEMAVTAKKPSAYESDFFKWTKTQSNFLKKKEFDKLDIENLMEEIESLGRSEKRALESHLTVILLHLLKIQYQPMKHTRSWDLSIKNSAHKAQKVLSENPSLKPHLKSIVEEAYFTAKLQAAQETGLEEAVFPEKSPWSFNDLMLPLTKQPREGWEEKFKPVKKYSK